MHKFLKFGQSTSSSLATFSKQASTGMRNHSHNNFLERITNNNNRSSLNVNMMMINYSSSSGATIGSTATTNTQSFSQKHRVYEAKNTTTTHTIPTVQELPEVDNQCKLLHERFVHFFKNCRFEEALGCINESLLLRESTNALPDAMLHYYQALTLKSLGKFEDAIKSMNNFSLLLGEPNKIMREVDIVRHSTLSECYYLLRRMDDAITAQTDLINCIENKLQTAYEQKQKDDLLLSIVQTAIHAYETRAQYYMVENKYDCALSDMKRSIQMQQAIFKRVSHKSYKLYYFLSYKENYISNNFAAALQDITNAIRHDLYEQNKNQELNDEEEDLTSSNDNNNNNNNKHARTDFNLLMAKVGVLSRMERYQDAIDELATYKAQAEMQNHVIANARPYADLIIQKHLAELNRNLGNFEKALEYLDYIVTTYGPDEFLPNEQWKLIYLLKSAVYGDMGRQEESEMWAQKAMEVVEDDS